MCFVSHQRGLSANLISSRLCKWDVPCIRNIWLVHMWDMTHSYVKHDSFIRETWLIHMCKDTSEQCWSAAEYLHTCMRRVVHVWDMTHSYVDSFTCGTWLTYTCKEIWRCECTCLDPCLFIGGTGFLFIRGTGLTSINFEEIWSHHAIGCGYSHVPDTCIFAYEYICIYNYHDNARIVLYRCDKRSRING